MICFVSCLQINGVSFFLNYRYHFSNKKDSPEIMNLRTEGFKSHLGVYRMIYHKLPTMYEK
jgi:hypothetical protein